MPVQCPSCKTINRDSALFCEKCGTKISDAAEGVPKPTGRPDSLPTAPSTAPQHLPHQGTTSPPAQIPRIRTGASFPVWFFYLLILSAGTVVLFGTVLIETLFSYSGGTVLELIFTLVVMFFITLPIFRKLTNSNVYLGTVTHLRVWSPYNQPQQPGIKKTNPSWVFNLQHADKNWNPVKDSKGFLEPVIEVAYRVEKLHGPPVEEGCRVAIRGKKSGSKLKVLDIWNLGTPAAGAATSSYGTVFYGRVTNWTQPSQTVDMRYPGENRYLEVWSFRLQFTDPGFQSLLRDASGNLSDPIPVVIKAQSISGPISDGDKLEIHGQVLGNTLHPSKMINHSAGSAAITIRGQTTGG